MTRCLSLEALEDRSLCAMTPLWGAEPVSTSLAALQVAFNQASGVLTVRGDQADNVVRESIATDGYLELEINGARWSAQPFSQNFDPNLAGATSTSLRGILVVSGGGHDQFVMADQTLARSLWVQSDGELTIAGSLHVKDGFQASVSTIDVTGSIVSHAGFVRLLSTTTTVVEGLIDVSASGAK